MITGISGLVLKVSDLERSEAFYRDGLGLRFECALPGGVRLRAGEARLDLIAGAAVPAKPYAFARFGYHHFCLAVGNIQRLADQLYQKGMISSPHPTHNKDLNDGLWLDDPDGNAVEIVQYMPASPLMKACEKPWDYGYEGLCGIGHVSYVVENMERSLAYYVGELGFARVLDLDDDEGKPFLIFLRVADGAFVELFHTGTHENDRKPEEAGADHAIFLKKTDRETVPDILSNSGNESGTWIADPDGNRFALEWEI